MRKGFGFHDRHSPFRFNPASLFGGGAQGVWYDPSDFSTMFQDVAGTTPVTAVGQSVALIRDKSGRGNNATQSVAASMPTLNVDTNGNYFLLFDGSNDSLLTGSINFTATDKMTICAGLRKLSDASQGVLVELGTDPFSINGSFGFWAPSGASQSNYYFRVRGTLVSNAPTSSNYAPPISNVVTVQDNIAGDSATIRVNAVQAASSAADQGTGNFSNLPLYIGRRNNATLPFSGRLYGLIVLGAAASSWQVQVTEQWMAGKTGLQF